MRQPAFEHKPGVDMPQLIFFMFPNIAICWFVTGLLATTILIHSAYMGNTNNVYVLFLCVHSTCWTATTALPTGVPVVRGTSHTAAPIQIATRHSTCVGPTSLLRHQTFKHGRSARVSVSWLQHRQRALQDPHVNDQPTTPN